MFLSDCSGADPRLVLLRYGTGIGYRGGAVQQRTDVLRSVPLHEGMEEQQASKEEHCHDDHRR
jgi:hypothetical protein